MTSTIPLPDASRSDIMRRRFGDTAAPALGFLLVFGTYFTLANHYREHGLMNADEGFYAIAARSALEGKLPYRDFAYTQMPLLPYVNGALMSLSGFSMDAQRRINVFWGALALLTAVLALWRRFGRWEPGFAAAWCVAFSPQFASFQALGKSYAAAGFFLTASFAAIFWSGSMYRRTIAYAVFGALAAGTRLSLGLPVILALSVLMLESTSWRQRLRVVAIAAGTGMALILPFALSAPQQFFFFNFEFHMASVFMRRSLEQLVELWSISPAALLCCSAALTGLVSLFRRRLFSELLLLLAASLSVLAALAPRSAYGEYAVPSLLIAAMASISAMWATGSMPASPFRHVIWLLPFIAFMHPLPGIGSLDRPRSDDARGLMEVWTHAFALSKPAWLSDEAGAAASVEAAAAYIRETVPPGEILAAVPIVAVDAGRPVIPGTEMGQFSVMGPAEQDRAANLHLTTLPDLQKIVESRRPVAIVAIRGPSSWNFFWQSPSLALQPRASYASFWKAVDDNYFRAFASGDIEVLLPRN